MKPSSNRLAQRIAAALTDLELHHEDEPDEATAILCATVARVTAMTVGKQSLTESTGVKER